MRAKPERPVSYHMVYDDGSQPRKAGSIHARRAPEKPRYHAKVYTDGTRRWFMNRTHVSPLGGLYRRHGPVVEYPDGSKLWTGGEPRRHPEVRRYAWRRA